LEQKEKEPDIYMPIGNKGIKFIINYRRNSNVQDINSVTEYYPQQFSSGLCL